MRILRLSTLSLTLAVAIFALGTVNPAFAGKPGGCDTVPKHPSCKDDGGSDGDGATFTVEVFFDVGLPEYMSIGKTDIATGKTHGQRRTVSEPVMALNLTVFDLDLPDGLCMIDSFGTPTAQFALTTYKDKKSGDFTFVTASFFNFDDNTGINYGLAIGPPGDGDVVDEDVNGWLPDEGTTSVTGHEYRITAQKGSNSEDPCNVEEFKDWRIDVTAN